MQKQVGLNDVQTSRSCVGYRRSNQQAGPINSTVVKEPRLIASPVKATSILVRCESKGALDPVGCRISINYDPGVDNPVGISGRCCHQE